MNIQAKTRPRSLIPTLLHIVVVSSCFWAALFSAQWWHSRQKELKTKDHHYTLRNLATHSLTPNRLPTHILSQLLAIHTEKEQSLFSLHPEELKQQLMSCPIFSKVKVWRLPPRTLGVEYALRTPIATIAGIHQVAVDRHSTVFFLSPFYAPKKIPSVILPLETHHTLPDLQRQVQRLRETRVAIRLLEEVPPLINHTEITVESIDLSHYRDKNAFRREVIIVLTDIKTRKGRLYIRCPAHDLTTAVHKLPALVRRLMPISFRSGTIDLRYPACALLSGEVANV